MLISRRYRFLFVHIYKTGGTSITSALLPYATSKIQKRKNRLASPLGIIKYEPHPYFKHATANEIISQMGYKKYKSYFTFAFVRNPWDWQVSLYKYVLRDPYNKHYEKIKNFSGFDEYIRWRCQEAVRLQKEFVYSDNDEKQVDFIGKFENIEDDFSYICNKIGIKTELPHLNVSERKRYQHYYNDETAKLVELAYKPDIEAFDYKFNG